MDSDGNTLGPPSLIGVGAAAVDFQVGTGRMPMQNAGAQAQRKTPQFDDEQTSQLAAYVASLGAGPAVPDEEYLDTSQATPLAVGGRSSASTARCATTPQARAAP